MARPANRWRAPRRALRLLEFLGSFQHPITSRERTVHAGPQPRRVFEQLEPNEVRRTSQTRLWREIGDGTAHTVWTAKALPPTPLPSGSTEQASAPRPRQSPSMLSIATGRPSSGGRPRSCRRAPRRYRRPSYSARTAEPPRDRDRCATLTIARAPGPPLTSGRACRRKGGRSSFARKRGQAGTTPLIDER